MAKITLEKTDTIIRVSGPSSFLPLNAAVGSSNSQFKIVLDTKTAGADLSKIGTAADNTTLVFLDKSIDYKVNYNAKTGIANVVAKTGIANVVDSKETVIASLPIPKLAANNVRLHFADYADATTVTLSKPVGTSKALVLSSQPDLTPIVTLSSSAATVNEGSTVTYTATLDKVSATDLNIPYTLGGNATLTADYTGSVATTGTIKIVAGSKTGTLVLTAVNDVTTESVAETVTVTLGAVANVKLGVVTQSTTITDTSLTPIGKTAVPVTVGLSTNVVGSNTTAENFTFDAVAARATPDNTQRVITNFEATAGKDILTLNLPTIVADTTLASFLGAGTQGVTATVVEIGSGAGTLLNFGSDADGDLVTILLAGILTPADVVVKTTGAAAPIKTAVPVTVGLSTNVVGSNTAAENFTFDAVAARATADNTQRVITNFEATAGKDILTLDLPTTAAATTLASFLGAGTQGVTATVVEIGSGAGTLLNFGADANGDLVTILLAGILTPANVVVNII